MHERVPSWNNPWASRLRRYAFSEYYSPASIARLRCTRSRALFSRLNDHRLAEAQSLHKTKTPRVQPEGFHRKVVDLLPTAIEYNARSRAVKHSDEKIQNRQDRRDKNRRRRWLTAVNQAVEQGRIKPQCVVWLSRLAEQSSDTAKPVWGNQVKQAKKCRRTDRTIRNYRADAERAGLIETRRSPVQRNHDGTFSRSGTNLYVFVVPASRRKPRSHRPENPCRSNPQTTFGDESLRRNHLHITDDEPPDDLPAVDRWSIRGAFPWLQR